MISIFNNIAKRARKWMIILIILPFLTGIVAYIQEKNTPQTYTAQTTIALGNFQNEGYTNPKQVAKDLTSTENLKKWQSNSKYDEGYVKGHLNVLIDDTNYVQVRYIGTSQQEAKETLNDVVDGFLKESNHVYQEKRDILKKASENTSDTQTNNESVAKEKNIADFNNILADLEGHDNHLSEEITVSGAYINPMKRGIFGFILGLMLDIILLAIPEIFRDYK
jgi:teichuronic acid biosynthesis protein TuaF